MEHALARRRLREAMAREESDRRLLSYLAAGWRPSDIARHLNWTPQKVYFHTRQARKRVTFLDEYRTRKRL
jgi:hypothetical protein